MARLRLFVAWLMFAALPLQATASAAMWLCQNLPATTAAAGAHSTGPAGHPPADHAGHGLGHDLGAGAHPASAHHGAPVDGDGASAEGHRCASCAFCGHVLAQPVEPAHLAPADSPQSPARAPVAAVATRGLPVPDKPPRA